jgi:hypothetical protein
VNKKFIFKNLHSGQISIIRLINLIYSLKEIFVNKSMYYKIFGKQKEFPTKN